LKTRRFGPTADSTIPRHLVLEKQDNTELLAVAQRAGAIAIYDRSDESYGPEAAFEISGHSRNWLTQMASPLCPHTTTTLRLATWNWGPFLFFRRISRSPVAFKETPEFELKHPSVFDPDGLAFSKASIQGNIYFSIQWLVGRLRLHDVANTNDVAATASIATNPERTIITLVRHLYVPGNTYAIRRHLAREF
jgi:hypothetical protein